MAPPMIGLFSITAEQMGKSLVDRSVKITDKKHHLQNHEVSEISFQTILTNWSEEKQFLNIHLNCLLLELMFNF